MSESNRLPEGNYTAVAVRVTDGEGVEAIARWGTSGQDDKKQVVIYFEILDGPHAGARLPWFGYFTNAQCGRQKLWQRTMDSLRYCGFKGNDLLTLNEQALDQKVSIVAEWNDYEREDEQTGETREIKTERVAWVNRLGAGVIKLNKPLAKDTLRAFAAQMASRVSQSKEVEGETVARNGKAEAETGSPDAAYPPGGFGDDPGPGGVEDDIPF